MKANQVYARTAEYQREPSLSAKLLVLAVVIALLLASLPMSTAFAAPASDQGTIENVDFEKEWNNKLRNLRAAGYFYDTIRLYPADFEDQDDLAQAHFYLDNYGAALRSANTVVFNHAGFDIKGNVTNEIQAEQSLHDLGMYLKMMRGFKAKFHEQGYDYHRINK